MNERVFNVFFLCTANMSRSVPGEAIKVRAFGDAFRFMRNRINAFTALPLTMPGGLSLKKSLQDIGALEGAAQKKS